MDVDFKQFAARNGKKFQEISSLENQKRLNEILVVLINSLVSAKENSKKIQRKFKAWVDYSIKITIIHEATKRVKTKTLKKHLKNQE